MPLLPAVATGLLAWQWQFGGKKLRGNLRLHLLLGLVSRAMIWLVWWLHFRQRRKPGQRLTAAYLAVELVTTAVITLTGHLGGILSGVEAATVEFFAGTLDVVAQRSGGTDIVF